MHIRQSPVESATVALADWDQDLDADIQTAVMSDGGVLITGPSAEAEAIAAKIHLDKAEELEWIEHIARVTGRPITTLVSADTNIGIWHLADRLAPEGLSILPQVGARPASVLMTLDGTLNPMRQFPAYREIQGLAYEEQRRLLLDPEFRAKVLADEPTTSRFADANTMISTWHKMYVLPQDLSYEPGYSDSIAGVADWLNRQLDSG